MKARYVKICALSGVGMIMAILIVITLTTSTIGLNPTDWTGTGNSASSTDFLGTTNNEDLRFYTNNNQKMVIRTDGNVGIGTVGPVYILDLKSKSSVGSATFVGSGLDDLTSGGAYTGSEPKNYRVQIDGVSPDSFKWSDDGGVTWKGNGIVIDRQAQILNDGVTVTFTQTTGHLVGDYWDFSTTVTNPFSIENPANKRLFYVGNDGKVGIGTEYPQEKLTLRPGSNLVTMWSTPKITSGQSTNVGGGTLIVGTTYEFVVVAVLGTGGTTIGSEQILVVILAHNPPTPNDNAAIISWSTVPGATSYRVYETSVLMKYWTTTALTITITGTGGTAGNPPDICTDYVNKIASTGDSWFMGGNIGIGTMSPGAKLDVRGSAIFNEDAGNYDFKIEGISDPNLFVVDASEDKIGIGVSSNPTQKLHVAGSVRIQEHIYDSTNSKGTNGFVLETTATGIKWVSKGDEDWAWKSGSGLTGVIYHTGDVGIGTDDPNSPLEVKSSDAAIGTIGFADSYREIWFDGGCDDIAAITNTGLYADVNARTDWGWWSDARTAHNAYLTIKNNGKVGISTINPSYVLDIKGMGTVTLATPVPSNAGDLYTEGPFTGSSTLNYKVMIDGTGTPDTFKWSDDGGSTWDATGVSITGSGQSLNNGVTIKFGSTTGHNVGDYWTFSASPENIFGIQDKDGTRIVHVGHDGKVGIGTTNPTADLHIDHVLRLEPGSAPSSPNIGDIYYDSSTNKLRVRINTGWVDLN
jgi:hypothetical protein